MAKENELKFMFAGDESVYAHAPGSVIEQGYFTTDGGIAAWLSGFTGDRRIEVSRRHEGRRLPNLVVPISDEDHERLRHESLGASTLPLGDRFEARVRIDGIYGTFTLKSGKGAQRTEFEVAIPSSMVRAFFEGPHKAIVGSFIEKERYRVPLGDGLAAEIDVYEGANAGLVVVEIEFPTVEQMEEWKTGDRPEWIGTEVTPGVVNEVTRQLGDLSNAALALVPYQSRLADNGSTPQLG